MAMALKRFWLVLCLALGACRSGTGAGVDSAADTSPKSGNSSGETPADSRAQPRLPVGSVEIEAPPRQPLVLKVEVASTPEQRQMGLMFRKQLAPDEGMIFLFETERYNSFWMRNTPLSLDMLFIDSEWTIVGILHNVPPMNDEPRRVTKMSQYVLEVNAGVAAANQLSVGAKVRFTPPSGGEP